MKICIIGGTGHIGGHLVPMFLRDGAAVTVIVRGRSPIPEDAAWKNVRFVEADYSAANARWPELLRAAVADADTLIDLLGIDLAATYESVKSSGTHLIACGSIWMLGTPRRVPCPPEPQCEFWGVVYAVRWKTIQHVRQLSAASGSAFTAILPPNICGPGKIPLEPRGGRSIEVHRALAAGETVILPDGADVLIGPCDAEDVARAFYLAAKNRDAALDRIFNVGSEYALTATEFVATYADIYGVKIPIRRVSWDEFASTIVTNPGARYHFESHMCPDIRLTRDTLGYAAFHTPEQSMRRAVDWMRSRGLL